MDPLTHLEYALFQLTPTRTRCDLLVFSGKNKEKLASGLVEPFISHLKFFKDEISKGGYSVTLRPPTSNDFWFTRSTFQRLVRFINSPEVLERFIRIEQEISQIENSVQSNELYSTNIEEQAGEGSLSSSDGSTKKSPDSSKLKTGEGGGDAQEENSKIQLQRLLETRKAMLRKEQAMAYARALVAGFEPDNMNDLILFADNFGAARLREACMEFKDLCKKKHNDGLWMDELAAMAAYPPSELAYSGTSGLLLASESNASSLSNALNFMATSNGSDGSSELQANPEGNKDNVSPAKVQVQMPWPNQIPQYMYNFPGPQGQTYPYPYPGMPPYYPAHMSWPPNPNDSSHGRHHKSSSKKKSKSPLPESSEDDEEVNSEQVDSDSMSDSESVSKHKKNKKKSSKTVVIRNINYITSNRSGVSDDEDEDDSVDHEKVNGDLIKHEVDGVLESLSKHHNKSKSKKKGAKFDSGVDLSGSKTGKQNENWDAFQNLILKDDVQDEHFTIRNSKDGFLRNDAMDLGSESVAKKQLKPVTSDSFVVSERYGVDEERKVNFQDFENVGSFHPRMTGRDSSDADLVNLQRSRETGTGAMKFSDLESGSLRMRNGREEDWFVVNNSERTIAKSTYDDGYLSSMKGDVFSSETTKDVVPIDDSFMVQPRSTLDDSQWRTTTDVSMVEGVTKTDPTDVVGKVGETGFYEPDDLYLMVSRESVTESSVRSSWTAEVIDYATEGPFTKSEPKPAPVEMKDQPEEKVPVKTKPKKVTKDIKPRVLSRSLPNDKRLPFVSRQVVPKSKREQEEENRKRMEELALQRQKRIAERTAASGGSTPTLRTKTAQVNRNGGPGQLKKTSSKVTGV